MFGWAVHALFGRTTPRDQMLLSGLVASAVVWPVLLLGIVAPKVATFALTLVPLPHSVPSWIVRLVWLGLAVAVPVTMGLTLAARRSPRSPSDVRRASPVVNVLRGFPITAGLALAFLILFVSVPVFRLLALFRRERSADVPLITDTAAYHEVAAAVVKTLNQHGFHLRAAQPSFWVKAPTRILAWFGGSAFAGFVPLQIEHYVDGDLTLSFYTSGVLVRGRDVKATWAHGLIVEATAHGPGLQTFSPKAQEVEREIRRLWQQFEVDRQKGTRWPSRLADTQRLARGLAKLDVGYDDWQAIYRQLLQLERAIRGEPQLLENETAAVGKRGARPPADPAAPPEDSDPMEDRPTPLVPTDAVERQRLLRSHHHP